MSRHPISDLDLYANLKQRQASGSELSQDRFVASVRSKIDAGPTSVRMSRAPAFVGLASVVAVLLVLVVALPALGPGPSATAPSSSEPSPWTPRGAMSAAEFQSRFLAEELNGQSVLLNGRIEAFDDGSAGYGLDCNGLEGEARGVRPTFTCTMGRIVGTQPTLWAQAPYLAEAPETWRAAASPAEGALLLYVTPVGFIHYIGTVAVTASEPTSVRAASALHLESLELDDVVLVDASLTGVAARECPANPSSIPDLPGRGCEPSTLTDASGTMTVQDNAYFEFAPDAGPQPATGSVTPRRALYAVAKRLEGCGDEPCWQWQVVARLGGESESTPSPMPTVNGADTVECPGNANVLDRTRLVVACRLEAIDRHNVADAAVNPDGDLRRVRLEWGTNVCVERTGVGAEVLEEDGTLSVDIIERPTDDEQGCDLPGAVALELSLSRDTDVSDVGFSITHAPPYQQPLATPNGRFQCVDSDSGHAPTVIDMTGLVVSCEVAESTTGHNGVWVTNMIGDSSVLQVEWSGNPCDLRSTFTFEATSQGYVLNGQRPNDEGECQASLGRYAMRINLNSELDAATVVGSLFPDGPAPNPIPPESARLDCSDDVAEEVRMFFTDNTGLVTSCEKTSVTAASDGNPLSLVGLDTGDTPGLRVNWSDSSCYGAAELRLEPKSGGGYSITINPASDGVMSCVDFVTNTGDRIWRGVVIHTREAIDPESVEVLL